MDQSRARVIWSLVLLLTSAPVAAGRTWIVDASGGGDFTLVSEGCAAAADGDTVAIMPGDYDEYSGAEHAIPVDSVAVSILGMGSTPEETRLRLRIRIQHGSGVLVENLTFHDEWTPLVLAYNDQTTLRRCRFENNIAGLHSAAFVAYAPFDEDPVIEDCMFYRNRVLEAGGTGGATDIVKGHFRRCVFIENEAPENGGAIDAGNIEVEDCLFVRNISYNGAALTARSNIVLKGCTFWENRTTWEYGAAVELSVTYQGPQRCIVGKTINGYGVGCWSASTMNCFCFWENERGATAGGCASFPSDGNFEGDPLFCDPDNDDFTLRSDSPCLPGNHGGMECGLIGALDRGCGASPALETTWGRIKHDYRTQQPAGDRK